MDNLNTIYKKSYHITIVDHTLWDCCLETAIELYLLSDYFPYIDSDNHPILQFVMNFDEVNSDNSSHNTYPVSNALYSCQHTTSNTNNSANVNPCEPENIPTDTNPNETNSLVVNLSSKHLSTEAVTLLSRGMKFCPTPGEPDISQAQADLDSYHLKLKRFLFFHTPRNPNGEDDENRGNKAIDEDSPFKHPQFKNPSPWVPPPVTSLEGYIAQNNSDLIKCKINTPRRQNISPNERKAIKELSSDSNIIVKPADKGGAVVILNREDYIAEGIRQLSDSKFYIQTDTDLSKTHFEEINSVLRRMLDDGEIDDSCFYYLNNRNYRTSQFYMLPKIHKRLQNPPGRPIVSGNGCPTERISQFCDFFLQPIVKDTRSYIKDTTHFLQLLRAATDLPQDTLLVTLDVSSLYTNIPNRWGITACEEKLLEYLPRNYKPRANSIIELLKLVLTKNNFDFNNLHYLQVGGTAMGTKVAPSYANIFMDWFERNHVYTYDPQPVLWKRYIDDIFILWTHGVSALNTFIDYLNSRLESIKFESHISDSVANFLDVSVKISNGKLSTSLYTKETDSLSYLDYSSCHPKSCKNAIPYSQFLRLRKICSDDEDFIIQSRKLALSFHKANYPDQVIQSGFVRAFNSDREVLLAPKYKPLIKEEKQKKLFLITGYHPTFRAVLDIVSKNEDMLDKSSSTRPILNVPLVRGFRRPKNLRDLLVRARISKPNTTQYPQGRFSTICHRVGCIYCNQLNRTGTITCPLNGRTYTTRHNITCTTNNIIYCLACTRCDKLYVGQTKRTVRERIGEHFTTIRRNKQQYVVGRHFNSTGHTGTRDVRIYVLEFISIPPDSPDAKSRREDVELKWIYRLRSAVPLGLNLMD